MSLNASEQSLSYKVYNCVESLRTPQFTSWQNALTEWLARVSVWMSRKALFHFSKLESYALTVPDDTHWNTHTYTHQSIGAAQLSHSSESIAGAQEMNFMEHFWLCYKFSMLIYTVQYASNESPSALTQCLSSAFILWLRCTDSPFLNRSCLFLNSIISLLYCHLFLLPSFSSSLYPSWMLIKHVSQCAASAWHPMPTSCWQPHPFALHLTCTMNLANIFNVDRENRAFVKQWHKAGLGLCNNKVMYNN